MDDFDFSMDQFDDELSSSPLNHAIITIVECTEEVLSEMKEHLNLNEKRQAKNKLEFLIQRMSQLAELFNIEDSDEYTDEEIEKMIHDAELHSTQVDYNTLFAPEDGEESKHGLDVLDYIDENKDDDFDF